MLFIPVTTSIREVLSQAVKDIIAKEVAEKVYQEMKSGKYIQDAYLLEIANHIAKNALNLEIIPLENVDGFRFLKA